MNNDPTLQEIWDARQKIWENCEGNSAKLLEYYRQLQQEHSYKLVRFEQVHVDTEEIESQLRLLPLDNFGL